MSFALQQSTRSDIEVDFEEDIRQKVELLTKFCNDLLHTAELNDDDEESYNRLIELHDQMTVAILARMLHIPHLRMHCKDWLLFLHRIPPIVLSLLKMLVISGSRGNVSTNTKDHHQYHNNTSYRGTRGDALLLLGQLVFVQHEEVASECLHYLLWNAISDDFELRSRMIEVLTT